MKTKLDQLKVSQEKIDEMIRQRKEKIDDLQNSVQTGKQMQKGPGQATGRQCMRR